MNLKIDIYYKHKTKNKFNIFHDNITEEDIQELAKQKTKDNLPMWMNDEWEFESANVVNIET